MRFKQTAVEEVDMLLEERTILSTKRKRISFEYDQIRERYDKQIEKLRKIQTKKTKKLWQENDHIRNNIDKMDKRIRLLRNRIGFARIDELKTQNKTLRFLLENTNHGIKNPDIIDFRRITFYSKSGKSLTVSHGLYLTLSKKHRDHEKIFESERFEINEEEIDIFIRIRDLGNYYTIYTNSLMAIQFLHTLGGELDYKSFHYRQTGNSLRSSSPLDEIYYDPKYAHIPSHL